MEIDYGVVWAGVRASLMYERDALQEAYAQQSHEKESIALDAVARTMIDRIRIAVEMATERNEKER